MTPPLKTTATAVFPNNVSSSKQTATNSTTRRPLNLTAKQLEERRLKNPKQLHAIFHVSRLKKLMALTGISVHCLCVMICLQLWNEETKQLLILLVHWKHASLQRQLGSLLQNLESSQQGCWLQLVQQLIFLAEIWECSSGDRGHVYEKG